MRKSISIDEETQEILKLLEVENFSKFVRYLIRGDARVDVETDEKTKTKTYTTIYEKWKKQ